jgi:hypothetical protein
MVVRAFSFFRVKRRASSLSAVPFFFPALRLKEAAEKR